jgi:dipeptidase E
MFVFGHSRARDLEGHIGDFVSLGYRAEELDLRDYFEHPDRLAEHLEEFDLVWVVGGNSFVLARAMKQVGFGDALRARINDEAFTYAGFSAGACVAGPDLRGIELMDEPDKVPPEYPANVEPAGLGLVPFRIVPHWRSNHPETAAAENAVAYLDRMGLEYRSLQDGEVLVLVLPARDENASPPSLC